jgi:4-hydroxybenzoate polyprenyltransferase
VYKAFISSPIFISLVFVFVAIFSCRLYHVAVSPIILLLAFLTTVAVYSLNRVTDQTEDAINKSNQNPKNQSYFIMSTAICHLIVLTVSIIMGIQVFLVFITPLVIGFIYSVKIFKPLPRLKTVLGVKNIAVAFSWAFTGSLLPILTGTASTKEISLVFLYIFIQFFIGAVLFDNFDTVGDKAVNVKTIPLQLGKKKNRQFLLIINSLLLLWLIYCITTSTFTKYLPAIIFGILHSYVNIWYFTTDKPKKQLKEILIDGQWVSITILCCL